MASAGNHRYAKALVFEESSDYNSGESNTLVCQNGILYFNGNQLSSTTGNQFDIFTANKVTALSEANITVYSNLVINPLSGGQVPTAGQGFQSYNGFLYYDAIKISFQSNIFDTGSTGTLTSNNIQTAGSSNLTILSNLVVTNVMTALSNSITLNSQTLHFANIGPNITFDTMTPFKIQPLNKGGTVQFMGAKNIGTDANVSFVSTEASDDPGTDVVNLRFKNTGDAVDPLANHTVATLKSSQTTTFSATASGGGSMTMMCRDPTQYGTSPADTQVSMIHANTHTSANTIVLAPESIANVGIMAGYAPGKTFQIGSNGAENLYFDNASNTLALGRLSKIVTPSNVWVKGGGDRVTIGSSTEAGSKSVVIGTEAGAVANVVSIGFGPGVTLSEGVVKIGVLSGASHANSVSIGTKSKASLDGVAIGSNAGTLTGIYSVSVGKEAGAVSQSGNAVAIGRLTGQFSQESNAVAIGCRAGNSEQKRAAVSIGPGAGESTQGSFSVAIGVNSGKSNQKTRCVAIGPGAGERGQNAYSVAIGNEAGYDGQSANSVAIGNSSGRTGQNTKSVAMGFESGFEGQYANSVAIGYQSGKFDQKNRSVAIGDLAGRNEQGSETVAIGAGAGESTQGSLSVAIGSGAGRDYQNTAAVAIGINAGLDGQYANAIAIGNQAGRCNQQQHTVAIGQSTGFYSQNAFSIALGYTAASSYQGSLSVAIGNQAGHSFQSSHSVAIGDRAGYESQNIFSVAIGRGAGESNQSSYSVAIGVNAGRVSLGAQSVAIGIDAARIGGSAVYATTIGAAAGYYGPGDYSTVIGHSAGFCNQGNQCTFLGNLAGYNGGNHTNSICINASGSQLNPTASEGFFVRPIRNLGSGTNILEYNPGTHEITYGVKTFVIDHPDDKEKYLVHGCLEGPEGGVYYRGRGEVGTSVVLPKYVPNLIKGEPTIQITPIYNGSMRTLNCSEYDIDTNSFEVFGTEGPFYWTFTAKRCDVNVEPLKAETSVNGNGPYLFTD